MFHLSLILRKPVQDFRSFPTPQTGIWDNNRRWLEALNFGFRKNRDCAIYVVKTKALISCVVADLGLVFAYAKSRYSHDMSHFMCTIKANCP